MPKLFLIFCSLKPWSPRALGGGLYLTKLKLKLPLSCSQQKVIKLYSPAAGPPRPLSPPSHWQDPGSLALFPGPVATEAPGQGPRVAGPHAKTAKLHFGRLCSSVTFAGKTRPASHQAILVKSKIHEMDDSAREAAPPSGCVAYQDLCFGP